MNLASVASGAGGAALPSSLVAGAVDAAVRPLVLASAAAPVLATPTTPAAAKTGLGAFLGALGASGSTRVAEGLGDALAKVVKAVTASATSSVAATSGTGTTSLAFLKDGRLSVEEKLARLMVYLSDKYEKQLEQKLRQYGDLEAKGSTTATSTGAASSSSSPLSAVTNGLKSVLSKAGLGGLVTGTFLPQLATQLAAPVLAGAATALGMPALAPVLLQAGPFLGSLASGAVSALTGGKASTSTAKATSASSTSTGASAEAPSEKQLMTEIQILQEKQKEMFTLVSNILRSMHDTKMGVIGNIR
jgi:hypothetical protein